MCWAIEQARRLGRWRRRVGRCGDSGRRAQWRASRRRCRFGQRREWGQRGQATVEAALALPLLLLLALLLLQPGILLYDRMVMADAAAQGARFQSTLPAGDPAVEDFVRRRLGAVPPQDLFHCHEGGCTWDIEATGGESSPEASVRIANQVRPLPLIDYGAGLLGLTNGAGNFEVEVSVTVPTQPAWAQGSSLGLDPSAWVAARDQ